MKKSIITIILVICLAFSVGTPALCAASLSNFDKTGTYQNDFIDVSPDAWYFDAVRDVYERGIMVGKGAGIFDPSGALTIAETITLASILHKGYFTGSMDFAPGDPWYAPYVQYALANGIPAGAYKNMNALATRADFAVIISGGLPGEAITPINRVDDGAVPDVFESYSYGQAVYRLYRAGVLAGSDSIGTYYPGRRLTRAEAATIITRIVDADARVKLSLAAELGGEQIYSKASPAVFYIEIYDKEGLSLKTGSGFFISATGLAVTNYHVVIGAYSAKITTDDGEVLDVTGIYDYNWKRDTALIQIDRKDDRDFAYLETADSSDLKTGATVYTLGSPLGLQASFTKGIVSRAQREIEGSDYIQLDAPISSGSSGGVLLDTSCRAIGVTSATMTESQNINLAVPINYYTELSRETHVPLSSILPATEYYKDMYPAPDFGVYFNVPVFNTTSSFGESTYSYKVSDLQRDADEVIDEYAHLVEQNFFSRVNDYTEDDVTYRMYYNSRYGVIMTIGIEEIRDTECITVSLW